MSSGFFPLAVWRDVWASCCISLPKMAGFRTSPRLLTVAPSCGHSIPLLYHDTYNTHRSTKSCHELPCCVSVCGTGRHPSLCFVSQLRISCDTQQSLTCGSSYISTCRLPLRSRCSIAETSRDEMAADCVLKVYRTKRLNFGCAAGGFDRAIRRALHGCR